MISAIDLDIYNTLFHEKALTEKYLGHINYNWLFSTVKYTAECTVGYPFDLFDKTIVGILLIDECLGIEEIGAILGMNLIDNPVEQQYKDMAEYDILRMALDNLKDYQMIEVGDIHYSACRLTKTGKEYAEKGRKFKIEENKPFQLYYDHTSNNHLEAKTTFENSKGISSKLISEDFSFLEEDLMKQLATIQAPNIYNLQNGNSFINPKINQTGSKTYTLELKVGLIYNLISQDIRLLAYDPKTKTFNSTFTKWLTQNRKEEITQEFIKENQIDDEYSHIPIDFVQDLDRKQKQLGGLIKESPEQSIAIAKETNANSNYIDIEYFWNNLDEVISKETQEIWFFLPEYNSKILEKAIKLESCQKPIFFIFQKIDDEKLYQKILDFHKKSESISNYLFVSIYEEVSEFRVVLRGQNNENLECSNFKLDYLDDEIRFSVLEKKQTHPVYKDLVNIKKELADSYLRVIQEEVQNYNLPERQISKDNILSLENIDKKAMTFLDLEDYKVSIQQIKKIKEEYLSQLKKTHQSDLSEKLEELQKGIENNEIKKLEDLEEIKNGIKKIKNECLKEFIQLIKNCKVAEQKVHQEEKRIKEEVLSKTFIIDTNIFIYEPDIISKIEKRHQVVLSHTVINELDKLKQNKQVKEKASLALKTLNKLLGKNKRLKTTRANLNILVPAYRQNAPDNRILSVAYSFIENNPVILTEDNGLQLKAKSLEIPIMSLRDMGIEKQIPKRNNKNKNRRINYVGIFKQMRPTKYGNYPIGIYLSIIKKRNPHFDFRKLGFKKPVEFIESLGYFEIINNKFMKLKSK